MKGIKVRTRSYERDSALEDHHYAGVDRRKVLDAAIATLPAACRAAIAKQLGGVLEKGPRGSLVGVEYYDETTRSCAYVWVSETEIVQ